MNELPKVESLKPGEELAGQKEETKAVAVNTEKSPAEIAVTLLAKGVKPEDLEKLLTLFERDEANKARKAYHVAMTAFKANPPEIVKDKTVNYETTKGITTYNHPSLANSVEKINAELSKHGLSANWKPTQSEGKISITCIITHILGHSEEATLSAEGDSSGGKNSIQAIGSTVAYLERYTLLALTGLAAKDQDDDGRGSESTEYIDEKQLNVIRDYVDNVEMDKTRFLKWMKAETVEEIQSKDYNKAIKMLEAKKQEGDQI